MVEIYCQQIKNNTPRSAKPEFVGLASRSGNSSDSTLNMEDADDTEGEEEEEENSSYGSSLRWLPPAPSAIFRTSLPPPAISQACKEAWFTTCKRYIRLRGPHQTFSIWIDPIIDTLFVIGDPYKLCEEPALVPVPKAWWTLQHVALKVRSFRDEGDYAYDASIESALYDSAAILAEFEDLRTLTFIFQERAFKTFSFDDSVKENDGKQAHGNSESDKGTVVMFSELSADYDASDPESAVRCTTSYADDFLADVVEKMEASSYDMREDLARWFQVEVLTRGLVREARHSCSYGSS